MYNLDKAGDTTTPVLSVQGIKQEQTVYQCTTCKKIFQKLPLLLAHQRTHAVNTGTLIEGNYYFVSHS